MFEFIKSMSDMATRFPFWKPILPLYSFDQLDYSPYKTKKVALSAELNVAYVDEGEGQETLIFLHGMGNNLMAFKGIIPLLKDEFRCIAIDFPGFGKSAKSMTDGSMKGYAKMLAAFMKKLGLEKANFVGHSMGAQVALWFASLYPEQCQRLVLAAPAGLEVFTADERNWLLTSMNSLNTQMSSPQQIWASVQANFHKMPPEAWFLYTDRLAIQTAAEFANYCEMIPKCVAGMVDELVLDILPEIKAPILLVFGKEDGLIPNPIIHARMKNKMLADAAMKKLPNAELHWIPQCGHFVPLEKPVEFAGFIRGFVD